jgi:hypothetical protein
MDSKKYVRGVIGYTILKSKNIKVMVIADMHDIKDDCGDILISEWLKSQKNFKLLLEEVPPSDIKLKELWGDAEHVIQLRKLYLDNIDKIVGLDIRGELLKFSWELLKDMHFPLITLEKYLIYLEKFFNFKHKLFLKEIPEIYNKHILLDKTNKISIHYARILKIYKSFKQMYSNMMKKTVQEIYQENSYILKGLNFILNMIMEFYTIMQIYKLSLGKVNKFIIHKGLYHTSNIVKFLKELYNFDLIETDGLTDFDKVNFIEHNGCLKIPNI